VAGLKQLTQRLAGVGIRDHGAGRDRKINIFGGGARLGLALAVLAPFGFPLGSISIVEERSEVAVGAHVHASPVPAIASVGTALGLVLEPGKGACSRTAGPAHHAYDCTIDEHQLPGVHPSRTVRQSSLIFFHSSNDRSGLTIESTPSICPKLAPALSAPRR